MTETNRPDPMSMTESAAKRILFLRDREGAGESHLRVNVTGGGCSGFQYGFEFDTNIADDDIVIERDGVKLLVDPTSLLYVIGGELDFVEDLAGSAFKISNPNATASCGCGSSFAV
ncbi:MAG: iron-sulfur cluster insertion protein ErpA [Sphingomonadales bacterium]|nr:iron-sulfur cluster insertion protein ErpA [Sphingomonadales bacterium]